MLRRHRGQDRRSRRVYKRRGHQPSPSLIGRKCTIPLAGKNLTPCLWWVLLGQSTDLRKTTVLELVKRLGIRAAGDTPTLLPQTCSMDGFLDTLRTCSAEDDSYATTGWFVVNEFGLFLSNLAKRCNEASPRR